MTAVGALTSQERISATEFRGLMSRVPTSVAVVAGFDEGAPVGLTVGTLASVSLDPPLASVCVARSSLSWPRISPAGRFSVSVLSEAQHDVCEAFSARDDDKFRSIDWSTSQQGLPWITGGVAHLDCEIDTQIEAGDHLIVVGRVLALDPGAHDAPMVFHGRRLGGVRGDG